MSFLSLVKEAEGVEEELRSKAQATLSLEAMRSIEEMLQAKLSEQASELIAANKSLSEQKEQISELEIQLSGAKQQEQKLTKSLRESRTANNAIRSTYEGEVKTLKTDTLGNRPKCPFLRDVCFTEVRH